MYSKHIFTRGHALTCLLVLGAAALIAALSGLLIMLLWNWVVVSLLHADPIGYWLGVGIALLLSLISGILRGAHVNN